MGWRDGLWRWWRDDFRRLRHVIPWWLARRRLRIGIIAVFMLNEGMRMSVKGWYPTYDAAAQMSNGFFALPAFQIMHVAITLLILLFLLGEER